MTCRSGSSLGGLEQREERTGRRCVRWKERHQRLRRAWVFPAELFAAAGAPEESCDWARPRGVCRDGEEWDRDCSMVLGH